MPNENIEEISSIANVPAVEAAETIKKADLAGVNPDGYAGSSESFDRVLTVAATPKTTSRPVRKRMLNSVREASVIKDSLEGLNSFERQWQFVKDSVSGSETSRIINDLNYLKASGTQLTQEQEFELIGARRSKRDLLTEDELKYNWVEALPGNLAGVTHNLIKGVYEGRGISAAGGLLGAGIGLGLGFVFGPPGGAYVGAKSGAITGTTLATTFLGIPIDTYKQSVGGIYEELGGSELGGDGSPQAENTRRNIAKGGGFLMAAVSLVPIAKLTKKIPFLDKIINPKEVAKVLSKTANAKWLRLAKDLGSSGVVEGGEESVQELISIMSENLGASWNGDDTSFFTAVSKSLSEWEENVERVGRAGFVGAVAGSAFVASGKAASEIIDVVKPKPKPKPEVKPDAVTVKDFDEDLPSDLTGVSKTLTPDEQGINSLKLADTLEKTSEVMKSTEVTNLLPDATSEMRQEILDEKGVSHIFVEKDQLIEWADTPEKAAVIEGLLLSNSVQDSELNSPILIESGKFSELVDKYPKDGASLLSKAEPEGATGKQYIDRLNVKQESDTFVIREDAFNEEPYLEQPTFDNESDDGQLLRARTKVVEALGENASSTVADLEEQRIQEKTNETRRLYVESEENINIVEDFLNDTRVFGDLTEDQKVRVTKKKPALSINPDTMSRDSKNRFLDDSVLNKRKVFDKKGGDAADLAEVFGFDNVDTFLDVLSSSPTVEQQHKNIKRRNSTSKFKEFKLIKAHRSVTEAHIDEMSTIARKHPEESKGYVIPKTSKFSSKAQERVGATKLKHLNANQHAVGERRSQTKSKINLNEGDVIESLNEKGKAAQNSELARETHRQIRNINAGFEFIAKLNSSETRAMIREAGAVYTNAINSLMSFYDFSSGDRDLETKAAHYNSFVLKMKAEGRGDFRILNDLLAQGKPSSVKDMTVDQVLLINKLLTKVVKQARLENKLLAVDLNLPISNVEVVAENIRIKAVKHPDFNVEKIKKPVGDISAYTWMKDRLTEVDSLFTNVQYITQRFDQGIGGVLSESLYQPLMGVGKNEGRYGQAAEVKQLGEFFNRFKDGVKKYNSLGKVKFSQLGAIKLKIEEFKDSDSLNNGRLTKADLVGILMNMGNAGNKVRVTNFGVSIDKVWRVLNRELSVGEFDFVQEVIWGEYDSIKPAIVELETLTTGVVPEFVEAEAFEAFGKTYKGGFHRIITEADSEMENLMSEQERLNDLKNPTSKGSIFPTNAYRGITRADHLETRTQSKEVLDISLTTFTQSMEEIIHDLTMRVPTRNAMVLLSDRTLSDAIKSVNGIYEYNVLVNSIAEQTNSVGTRNTRLYNGLQKSILNMLRFVDTGVTLSLLGFNPSTFAMSLLTIPQAVGVMGVKNGMKYLSLAAMELYNPVSMATGGNVKVKNLVKDIDPSLKAYNVGLDLQSSTSIDNLSPKKRVFTNKTYDYLQTMRERSNELALGKTLGALDAIYKSIVARGGYLQYRAGDAPNVSLEQIQKMDPNMIHESAISYAEQVSASATMRADTLSKAPIQKIPGGFLISKFWNESRSVQLSRRQDLRGLKRSATEMVSKHKEGDARGVNKALYGSVGDMGRMLTMSMVTLGIMNLSRGRDIFSEDDEPDEDLPFSEDLKNAPGWMVTKLTTPKGLTELATAGYFGNIVLLRDVLFSAETGRPFGIPVFKAAQDISTLAQAGPDFYENLSSDLTLIDAMDTLDDKEIKALLNTISVTTGGFGVTGPLKIKKFVEGLVEDNVSIVNATLASTVKIMDDFIKKFNDPSQKDTKDKSTMQQTVNQLKELRTKMLPEEETLSHQDFEIIKHAESRGIWNNTPEGRSSAFGVYQFIDSTWRSLVDSTEGKKAGLTISGRFNKDGKQQEKAIRILTKKNIRALRLAKVTIDVESVYFAHHFGTRYASLVFNSPSKKYLGSKMLSTKVLKANPLLVKRKVKTAGDMRRYIRFILGEGVKSLNRSRR